jgi:hypothetical protein
MPENASRCLGRRDVAGKEFGMTVNENFGEGAETAFGGAT